MTEKTIIEINGVKLEVDLRTARRVEELRVGDTVKVLVKSYGDSVTVYPGMIVGFEPFVELPTIIVAYINAGYNAAELKFVHINKNTKNAEIIKSVDADEHNFQQQKYIDAFDRDIEKKRLEIQDLEAKKSYFLREFGGWWSVGKPETPDDGIF